MNSNRVVQVFLSIALACWLVAPATPASSSESPSPSDPASLETVCTPGSWTLVVLPDIQSYVDHTAHYPLLIEIVQWIVDNRDVLDIALVLQMGDIVFQNDVPVATLSTGDQASADQWENAQRAFALLDGVVPYVVVPGNHDYGVFDADDRQTHFNECFQPGNNPLIDPATDGILVEMGQNSFGEQTLENACYDFTAPDGRQMLVLALEWGPRQTIVNWANSIARRNEYANHTKVLLTHAYMHHDETRLDWVTYGNYQSANPHSYGGTNSDTNDGEELWNKLVRRHPRFELVFSGHIGGDTTAYLASQGNHGNTVHQMLFNTQFLPLGGEGWVRLLEFLPDGTTAHVRTYSPYFANDGDPDTSPWRSDPQNDFFFQLSPLGS